MDILKFLQSKKIIPSKETIIKEQAKKLAKQISRPEYFLVKMDNEDLSNFSNVFVDEILNILTDRFVSLDDEMKKTNDAIMNLKCNK